MLAYLKDWLAMRVNAAPVSVKFARDAMAIACVMTHVDEYGVVLDFTSGAGAAAFPWPAIHSIQRA